MTTDRAWNRPDSVGTRSVSYEVLTKAKLIAGEMWDAESEAVLAEIRAAVE